jgi:hypothetical protein
VLSGEGELRFYTVGFPKLQAVIQLPVKMLKVIQQNLNSGI